MKRVVFLTIAISIAAASCRETFPNEQRPSPPPEKPLASRPANASCVSPESPLGRIRLEEVWRGFEAPNAMVFREDLGLVYVGEVKGRVKVIDRASGTITTALDLTDYVGKFYDTGLMGVAIHPTKPYAYVAVELPEDGTQNPALAWHGELLRFDLTDGGRVLDRASMKVVLRIDRPTFWHNFCRVTFGPDGFLYVGHGDGGGTLVPGFLESNPQTLLGKILRIDVDAAEPYAVPPDNPFAGGPTPEVWASGFRNPWQFSFDRATGELWVGDVGDLSFEEVNLVERGKNYGWPITEGERCNRPTIGCDRTGLTPPVLSYPRSEGSSITGGVVYRGNAMPDLAGKYIFADFVVGRIWSLDRSANAAKPTLLNPGGLKPMPSVFGEDEEGELYVADWKDGVIYKVVPGDDEPRSVIPERLSRTGCVDPNDATKPGLGLVPYDVNVELWSDGADKKRWLAIPDGTTIEVDDVGNLSLPPGGIAVKEFLLDGKRIETRLLFREPSGEWTGASYEWNDEQTDAVLLDDAKEKLLPNGQTWVFPSPAQCFACHTRAPRITLGLETVQLNRDFEYGPGHRQNQLTKLWELGMLDRKIDPETSPRLPALTGPAPIEDRARAYLHANCSMCHRADSGIAGRMQALWDLPRSALDGCASSPLDDTPDAMILAPGEPQRSAVYRRMTRRDTFQMPPLGTRLVDPVGSKLMEDWIASMTTCD